MKARALPRPVRVDFRVREAGGDYKRQTLHERAMLLGFGTDSEEVRDGVLVYSVGIIECPDGTLTTAALDLIQFLDADAPGVLDAPARPSRPVKEILRLVDVIAKTSLSKSAIYRAREAGTFPEPVKLLGSRAVGWKRCDIDAWLADPANYRAKPGA